MYTITLIGTYHSSEGRCNEEALYSILESIRPDVIFEEVPPSYYDAYYVHRTRGHNLEHAVISRYADAYNIPHVPVDSDDVPSETFFSEHKRMIGRVRGGANRHAWAYRSISEASYRCLETHGFNYLNNDLFNRHNDELDEILVTALKEFGEKRLLEFRKGYLDVIERRDNEMLANIYRYSADHRYDNAAFLVGAGHRRSIISKLQKYREAPVKLTWRY